MGETFELDHGSSGIDDRLFRLGVIEVGVLGFGAQLSEQCSTKLIS